jgi:DNA-binding IclR family transcriptional regulator
MPSDVPLAVKSADRVFDLFELLAPRREGLSHTEIAEALEIPKSSLTQLLKTATHRGYITYEPKEKCYRLGSRFADIAGWPTIEQDLVAQAAAVLEEVTASTQESSALNVFSGDMAKVVATVSSSQRLVSHMRLGDLAPLYATSGGKILLAHLSEELLDEYIGRVNFQAFTPATLRTVKELRKQLIQIREEGVARSLQEFTPGIVGVATIVLSKSGTPLASVNVAMPAVRHTAELEALAIDALRKAKSKLEARAHL